MTPRESRLGRYQAYRTRRFLENQAKTAHMLPRWRNRATRRRLVVVLGVVFVGMAVVAVASMIELNWVALAWLPLTLLFLVTWTTLQVISGRQSDAPADALDEWEMLQRNEARSIGLTVTQTLVFVPAVLLIVLSTRHSGADGDFAYGAGLLTLTTLIVGGCTPAMILGWTRPDPDPEDLA